MPVKPCKEDGKPGYKWGDSGKCYTYTPGNESSRRQAKKKAIRQGRAIQVNKDDECPECSIESKASDVQALIFDKPKFTRASAREWARTHGFNTYTDRETKNTIRLRQFPPDKCLRSGGMKELADGVQAYICPTKEKTKAIIEDLKSEIEEIKSNI